MNFTTFLNENKYKERIDIEKAYIIIQDKCKNSQTKPLWRGMSQSGECAVLDGSARPRVSTISRDSSDAYVNIINPQLKEKGYPLRTQCIIATGHNQKEHTKHFGNTLYAIFPYDDNKLCSSKQDLWNKTVKFKHNPIDFYSFNEMLYNAGIDDKNIDTIAKGILDKVETDSKIKEHFQTYTLNELKEALLNQFDINHLFSFSGTKDIDQEAVEVWFNGKCVAIREDIYNEVKEMLKGT